MANYDLTYEGSRVQGILDTGNSLKDAGYIFRGEATPSTVPGTPTERVAYIGGPGTYTNFGSSITVGAGCVCIFKYTGSAWSNQVIDTGLDSAVNTLQSAITAINNNIGNGYVYAGVATPATSPVTGKVFYLAVQAGTYTNFGNAVVTAGLNVIKYNGSAWSVDQVIAIDDEPTQGSNNLVKSGGVLNSIIQNGPAFDLSAYNAVGGTLATYADLSAALTALNALPAAYKKGGMSFKFVLSSDNKYVQARLMADSFTTDVTQWQSVDAEPTPESPNLVESGGVSYLDQAVRKGGIPKNAYYSGNHAVGETFKESAIQPNSGWVLYSMQCQKGDVINFTAYANYLIIVDIDNTIIFSKSNPFGSDVAHWMVIPDGGVHIYLCGQATKNHYLYLYPKMVLRYREYAYKMFLDATYMGAPYNGACYIKQGNTFKFYQSITYNADWQTRCINVENCPKVCITGYGHSAFSDSAANWALSAYFFVDSDMLPIAGAPTGMKLYNNIVVDVPSGAKYCIAQSEISRAQCKLYAITDKDNEILNNIIQTREQSLTDTQKSQVFKNLGIVSGDIENIVNDGYFCNATYSNIGDTVSPVLIANDAWCSNIVDVAAGNIILLGGYETTMIVLNSSNVIIDKKYYQGTVRKIKYIVPTDGVRIAYVTFKSISHSAYKVGNNTTTTLNVYSERMIQREPYNIVTVKKDGTGDFTSIQAAIDAVRPYASINNPYQVRIYDDWEFAGADLHYFNSGNCAVDTANYVHLYGCGGIRKLSILQNSENPSVQTLWWIGNCNLTNLHIRITKGRYAVHQSGNYSESNPPFITRIAENCIFEHTGQTDLGAIGSDIQEGEKAFFKNCIFISHSYGWYGHSTLKNYNAEITFVNCEFKTKKEIVNVSSLDSIYPTIVKIDNCTINKKAIIANKGCYSYGEDVYSEIGAVMPEMSVYGCGDFVFGASNSAFLRLQAQTGISITSISGIAYDVLFGGIQEERKGVGGLSGVIIGRNFVPYSDGSNHPYKYSLGKRLGDCSVTNKTMTIVLSNGNDITVTFDKNYSNGSGDTAPNYTNEQIIADINTALSSYGLTASIGFGSEHDFFPSTDRKNYVAAETSVIEQGKFVYIKPNGLVELANGNNISGFALADIPVNSNDNEENVSAMCLCKDILLGQPFSPVCSNTADGTKFTITNGELVEVSASSTDYVAIVYNNILKLVK